MQCQCLSNGIDDGFTKDILLDFMSCHFSLSWNLSLLIFTSIFTFHSYFSDVQCTTAFPTASRVTAKVKLFGLCSCTTALSLGQRDGNKGSHQRHSIATIWLSAPLEVSGGLSHPREKNMCPPVDQTVFRLISLLLGYFFPSKFLHPWKKENGMICPMKTNKQKNALSFLSNEHFFSKLGVLLNFFSFLVWPYNYEIVIYDFFACQSSL